MPPLVTVFPLAPPVLLVPAAPPMLISVPPPLVGLPAVPAPLAPPLLLEPLTPLLLVPACPALAPLPSGGLPVRVSRVQPGEVSATLATSRQYISVTSFMSILASHVFRLRD